MGTARPRRQQASSGRAGKKPVGDRKPDQKKKTGGLFRRRNATPVEELPAINAAAGLDRVLRQKTERPAAVGVDPEVVRAALARIEAALFAIDDVREIVEQAQDVVLSARELEDAGGRALLAESYDELRQSIDRAVDQFDENAARLVGFEAEELVVPLVGQASLSVTPMRLDTSSGGLGLSPPRDAFASFDEIKAITAELDAALARADRAAAGYVGDAQYLIARLDDRAPKQPQRAGPA
ncbi:MAG: hypothetical protein AAGC56_02675 [Pseudomonadota bacterium]